MKNTGKIKHSTSSLTLSILSTSEKAPSICSAWRVGTLMYSSTVFISMVWSWFWRLCQCLLWFPERIPSTTTRDPGPDRDKGGHDLFPDMTKEDKTSPQLTVTTTVEPLARTSSGEDPDVGTDHQPPPFTDRGPGRRREGEGDSDSNPGQGNLQMTCLPVQHQGVLWPQTRPGQVAEEPCPNGLEGESNIVFFCFVLVLVLLPCSWELHLVSVCIVLNICEFFGILQFFNSNVRY